MSNDTQRTLCLLFVDVAGSTTLYERLGDARAKERIDATLALLRACVETESGRWIKELGDGALAVFVRAEDAAHAARHARSEMSRREGAVCPLRFGLHMGRVIDSEADVHGDAVNVAARVMELAKPGEILLTSAVVAGLDEALEDDLRSLGPHTLDGRAEPIVIHELVDAPAARTCASPGSTAAPEAVLVLRYGGDEFVLGPRRTRAEIGRDAECEVVLEDERVSRRHAEIALVRGRFVLTDTSFNGTWVVPEGARAYAVRRDEITLHGRGKIHCGALDGPAVEYSEE